MWYVFLNYEPNTKQQNIIYSDFGEDIYIYIFYESRLRD